MSIDFWYENTLEDVSYVNLFFYPNDGIYRGNMYDINGKIIGDYSCNDAIKIFETFNLNVDLT